MATKTLDPKPEQKAESLTSRIFAATYLLAEPEKNRAAKQVVIDYLREVATLARFTFEIIGGEYATLTGHGLVLSDWVSATNLSFNLTGVYPKGTGNSIVTLTNPNGWELEKPSLRLTPGLTAVQAAKRLTDYLPDFRAYWTAVEAKIAGENATIDRTRQEAQRLIEAGQGRWYGQTPESKTETRKLVFYQKTGTHYATVQKTNVLLNLTLSVEDAERVLRLLAGK